MTDIMSSEINTVNARLNAYMETENVCYFTCPAGFASLLEKITQENGGPEDGSIEVQFHYWHGSCHCRITQEHNPVDGDIEEYDAINGGPIDTLAYAAYEWLEERK